jgi:guanine deaminase
MRIPAQTFLARAARQAAKTIRQGKGGPFGAVIVRGNRVVAVASNTVLGSKDSTCHAEINAIRIACRKLKTHVLSDCEIYSTTEPCPMCFSAIHWAQISRVVYSSTIPDVKRLGFNELTVSNRILKRLGKSPVTLARVNSSACRQLLRTWSRLLGARVY